MYEMIFERWYAATERLKEEKHLCSIYVRRPSEALTSSCHCAVSVMLVCFVNSRAYKGFEICTAV